MRVDPFYLTNLSASLNQSTAVEAELSAELSSGLRIAKLSDDPTAVAQSSLFASTISQVDTYVQTASTVGGKLQAVDSTLGEVVSQLTSALSLATKGGDGTLNAGDLSAVQQQLIGVRDAVLSLANTSYSGTYLFSGSQGGTQPFSLDTSTTPATVVYGGDSAVQSIETPNAQKISVNLPGSDVFTAAGGDVFGALNQLIADFSGATVGSSLTTDMASLKDALSHVSSQRVLIDNSITKLQSTSSYAQTQVANLTAAQGALVAADPAKISTQLSANETQRQALLSVISALGKNNLFDYLQ